MAARGTLTLCDGGYYLVSWCSGIAMMFIVVSAST